MVISGRPLHRELDRTSLAGLFYLPLEIRYHGGPSSNLWFKRAEYLKIGQGRELLYFIYIEYRHRVRFCHTTNSKFRRSYSDPKRGVRSSFVTAQNGHNASYSEAHNVALNPQIRPYAAGVSNM